MRILEILYHLTIGAYVSWAFGPDEGGGWENWKNELLRLLGIKNG